MVLLDCNALTLAPSSQGETVSDRSFTGSPVQFSVSLFSTTFHQTVGDSFLPKVFLSIPRMDGVHSSILEGKRYAYNSAEDGISVVTEAHVVQLPASTDLFLQIVHPSSKANATPTILRKMGFLSSEAHVQLPLL